MLDLFCGRLGIGKVFAARGWEVVAVDLVGPPEIPEGIKFVKADVRDVYYRDGQFWVQPGVRLGNFDYGWASSPCEKFAVFGMAHFHPDPPYPFEGIELFNHARGLFERAGIPYAMENVRSAWKFVGPEIHKCGPFSLWGKGVPPLMPEGITKGFGAWDRKYILTTGSSKSKRRQELKAMWATIPPELANTVADYAERLLEQRTPAMKV
jgi:hypothetical protein